MQRWAMLATGLAITLGACAPQADPQVDLAAEEQAVRAVSMRWLDFEKAKNASAIAALFTEDGILFREHRDPIVGHSAIQEYTSAEYAANPQQIVDWTTDRVIVAASGDLATEFGTWSASGGGASASGTDSGKYVTTFRKVNGEWKVASDMSLSTQAEGPPTTTSM